MDRSHRGRLDSGIRGTRGATRRESPAHSGPERRVPLTSSLPLLLLPTLPFSYTHNPLPRHVGGKDPPLRAQGPRGARDEISLGTSELDLTGRPGPRYARPGSLAVAATASPAHSLKRPSRGFGAEVPTPSRMAPPRRPIRDAIRVPRILLETDNRRSPRGSRAEARGLRLQSEEDSAGSRRGLTHRRCSSPGPTGHNPWRLPTPVTIPPPPRLGDQPRTPPFARSLRPPATRRPASPGPRLRRRVTRRTGRARQRLLGAGPSHLRRMGSGPAERARSGRLGLAEPG